MLNYGTDAITHNPIDHQEIDTRDSNDFINKLGIDQNYLEYDTTK